MFKVTVITEGFAGENSKTYRGRTEEQANTLRLRARENATTGDTVTVTVTREK